MFKFQVLKDQNQTLQAEVQKLQTLLSEPVQPVHAEVVSNILCSFQVLKCFLAKLAVG